VKICRKCNIEQPLDNFFISRATGKHTSPCRVCKLKTNNSEPKDKVYARILRWRARNPNRTKDTCLRRKYGITFDDYTLMLQEQSNCCAICKGLAGQRGFVVDHDHETGKVRGLLCTTCNLMLGSSYDDPAILMDGIAYLEESKNGMAEHTG